MRQTDPITRQLERWGHAQALRHAAWAHTHHPLESAADAAAGEPLAAVVRLAGRGSVSRRRMMAAGVGIDGMRAVPQWACSPVRCRDDSRQVCAATSIDHGTPDDLRWIDLALAEVHRQSPIRAAVVRAEYTEPGTQEQKAGIVAAQYGGKLSVHQYRRELSRGLDWVRMRSSGVAA